MDPEPALLDAPRSGAIKFGDATRGVLVVYGD
jgi:hypothetical protein